MEVDVVLRRLLLVTSFVRGLFIWEAGRDVRQDGTLFIPGSHKNVSTRDDFTRDNLQSQHNIVPEKRDGVFI